jgi:hypothetical protein
MNSEIHSEAMVQCIGRCTWRRQSGRFGDILGGRNWVNLEMYNKAATERVWRYALGGCDVARECRWTWRPQSSNLFGLNPASLEVLLQAVIVRVWTNPWTL